MKTISYKNSSPTSSRRRTDVKNTQPTKSGWTHNSSVSFLTAIPVVETENTVYVLYQDTKVSGEDIKMITASHNFFALPLIQAPKMYVNRLNISVETSERTYSVVIGVFTEEALTVSSAADITKKVQAFVVAAL